jgi:prevent-host-death family protein
MTVSIQEAKAQLSTLLSLVEDGEEIIISRRGRPVARLVRANPTRKPQIGAMRGEITWQEGWERALRADEEDPFWNGLA